MRGNRKHSLGSVAAALLLFWMQSARAPAAPAWREHVIGQVALLGAEGKSDRRLLAYQPLVTVEAGGRYQYRLIRQSIENLHRTGVFSDVEVKVLPRQNRKLDVLFILRSKPLIRSLAFRGMPEIRQKEFRAAVYSLKRNELFDENRLAKARQELQILLNSKGYFNAHILPRIHVERGEPRCRIEFVITPGQPARVGRLQVNADDPQLTDLLRGCFRGNGIYLPGEFAKGSEKARRLLKKRRYYYPDITITEEFPHPDRSLVDVTVAVVCGFRYRFVFQGMAPRMTLITDVWERRVFEKWAEEESRARLLNYLKNEGYLDARMDSAITTDGRDKTIVFTAEKSRRYRLGRIDVHGNRTVDTGTIRRIVHTDDLPFHKLAWLRFHSLVTDMEVLKLYYYYHGVSPVEIRLEPKFHGRRADIDFLIREGRRHRMKGP